MGAASGIIGEKISRFCQEAVVSSYLYLDHTHKLDGTPNNQTIIACEQNRQKEETGTSFYHFSCVFTIFFLVSLKYKFRES